MIIPEALIDRVRDRDLPKKLTPDEIAAIREALDTAQLVSATRIRVILGDDPPREGIEISIVVFP